MTLYTVIANPEETSGGAIPQKVIDSVLHSLQKNGEGFNSLGYDDSRWHKVPQYDFFFCMGGNRISFVPDSEPIARFLDEELARMPEKYPVSLLKE